jgi:hypothetical protein
MKLTDELGFRAVDNRVSVHDILNFSVRVLDIEQISVLVASNRKHPLPSVFMLPS